MMVLHLIIIGGVAEWVMGWAVVQGMLGNFDSDEDDRDDADDGEDEDDGDDEDDEEDRDDRDNEDDGDAIVETKHNVCCKMRGSSVGIHT